ncbi:hypothetical protein CDAR_378461 [Caerostris darwini]|uniref:Uncharacterized protein n=1 Tax=Caerostris darwini TaxID=1538125 RepID=A0AAV4T5A3_9ARAC|nr:hypothetical protein CDAR_378461 [Caerostris darwini]
MEYLCYSFGVGQSSGWFWKGGPLIGEKKKQFRFRRLRLWQSSSVFFVGRGEIFSLYECAINFPPLIKLKQFSTSGTLKRLLKKCLSNHEITK